MKAEGRMRKKKHMVSEEPVGYENGAIVLYQAPDGSMNIDVRLEKETLWLSQKQIAELFVTERSVITKHLRNIFNSGELDKKRNVQKCTFPAPTSQ